MSKTYCKNPLCECEAVTVRQRGAEEISLCASCGQAWDMANVDRPAVELAGPELLAALEIAGKLIEVARQYFPKSMHNHDKFQLENTNAAINHAIFKAKGDCEACGGSGRAVESVEDDTPCPVCGPKGGAA